MDNIKNIYALCGVSIIIIVCLVSVISTAAGKGIFIISDEWGSGRGYIWKTRLTDMVIFHFVNKIFPMFFCLIAMLNSGIRRYENMK